MDPLQVLPTALSLPADSPEQVAILAQLRDHLEQQPGPILALIPPLLGGVLQSVDSAFKRWILEMLNFGLSQSSIPLEGKSQLVLQSLDSLGFLLTDPSIPTCKSSVQCLSSGYPHLFRYLCSNKMNRGPWDVFLVAKRRIMALMESPRTPPGIVVAALKFVQRVVLVQSRGVSDPRLQNKSDPNLALCPPDHPFLRAAELETEGVTLLQQMLHILYQSQNTEILSAILNCTASLVKQRAHLIPHVLPALTAWTPAHISTVLSASEVKSVEKAARIVLIHILRHGYGGQFQKEISDVLAVQQARMDQAARVELARRAEGNKKRILVEPVDDSSLPKRSKTEVDVASVPASHNALASFDFTVLAQGLVIDLVVANLIAVSQSKLDAAVQAYRQAHQPPPVQSMPDVPVSVAPVKEEALDPLKMELDEDEIEYEPDKLNSNLEVEGLGDDPEIDDEELIAALQQVKFELPPARQLSAVERGEMIRSSLDRIRATGEDTAGSSLAVLDVDGATDASRPALGLPSADAWILLLVRMATRGPAAESQAYAGFVESSDAITKANLGMGSANADGIRQTLCDYVMEDFSARSRIATIWMNEEWYNDTIRAETDPRWKPQYDVWVQKLLSAQRDRLDAKDKAFSRFLIDLPTLPPNLLSLLCDMCIDPDIMPIGFTSLRELVTLRPPVRQDAMKILLDLTTHPEKTIRGAAIITVRRWVPDQQPMDNLVRAFARGMLQRLATKEKPPPSTVLPAPSSDAMVVETDPVTQADVVLPPVSDTRDEKTASSYLPPELVIPPERSVVLQHIELLLGLAVKVQDFLDQIFESYCRMEPSVQDILRSLIGPLVKTLGPSNAKLLELLRSFPPEAETLALQVLTILTDNVRPTPAIVSLIKDLLAERELNPKFLILIIGEMDKSDIIKNLPGIVSTLTGKPEDREQVRKVFGNIVTESPVGTSSNMPRVRQSERLAPAELMVLLHDQEKEIGLKAAIEAIGICFAMSDVFRSETLAVVMQQIVDEPTLPVLFMRTVIQAVTTYKNLVSFVTTTLFSRLIVKKIWTNGPLWEGFIRCAKITAPASFGALLQLQKEQLREVVDKQPSLKSGLREYVIKKERSKPKLASFLETLGDGGEVDPIV